MKKKHIRFLSLAFFLIGILFLLNSKTDITGAVVGVSNISSGISSIFGIVLILVSTLLFVSGESLEERLEEVEVIAEKNHWIPYHITPNSEPIDKRINKKTGKSTGLGYLNEPKDFPGYKNTPIQDRIERSITKREKILSYVSKDDDKLRKERRGETVNRRNSYKEQFYEPHAAGGGRIIEVSSHIKNEKLEHFNELADGEYIWVIDKEGNFIVGNRGGVDEAGDFVGMIHDMYQMPPDLGSGERHKKIDKRKTTLPHSTLARGLDVYGAGEVTIKDGLIQRYNADSGHYAKLETDIGGPYEPDNFVKQSIEAFKLFSGKAGWKEVKGGAKYNSQHFNL